jgi:hypothetical protein
MRPTFEVADVIREFLPLMDQSKMLTYHKNTLNALAKCRTAEMGGHLEECNSCVKDWGVYTKKPFAGVKHVVNYLARYSHRVAITNYRIKNIADGKVTIQYKDYTDGVKKKTMNLQGIEFLRRFCLHILPKGFRKVRQYGFLSNGSKAKALAAAKIALGEKIKVLLTKKERKDLAITRLFQGKSDDQCPYCKKGKWYPSLVGKLILK